MKKLLTLGLVVASFAVLAGCSKTPATDEAVAPTAEEVVVTGAEAPAAVDVATGVEVTVEAATGEVSTGN